MIPVLVAVAEEVKKEVYTQGPGKLHARPGLGWPSPNSDDEDL